MMKVNKRATKKRGLLALSVLLIAALIIPQMVIAMGDDDVMTVASDTLADSSTDDEIAAAANGQGEEISSPPQDSDSVENSGPEEAGEVNDTENAEPEQTPEGGALASAGADGEPQSAGPEDPETDGEDTADDTSEPSQDIPAETDVTDEVTDDAKDDPETGDGTNPADDTPVTGDGEQSEQELQPPEPESGSQTTAEEVFLTAASQAPRASRNDNGNGNSNSNDTSNDNAFTGFLAGLNPLDAGVSMTVGAFTIAVTDGYGTPEGSFGTSLSTNGDYYYHTTTHVLTITSAKAMTISMAVSNMETTTDRIAINTTSPAHITLDSVKIDVSGTADACAFEVVGTSTLNLTLNGTNVLKSNGISAGLQVGMTGSNMFVENAIGAAVIIDSDSKDNSLTAIGGAKAAGIGGASGKAGGTITINGGTISATGSTGAGANGGGAGIGGGYQGDGGTITINDGDVTALCASTEWSAAGIGGGGGDQVITTYDGGEAGIITINGGTVTAQAADHGSGIGSGPTPRSHNNNSVITVTGGTVTAAGSSRYAGIGGGYYGNGGRITITGGTITATGNTGVGGGAQGSGGVITISGGFIEATSNGGGAGIGGGGYIEQNTGGAAGTITISGGIIIASSGTFESAGADIGSGSESVQSGSVTVTGGTILAVGAAKNGLGRGTGSTGVTTVRIRENPVIFAPKINGYEQDDETTSIVVIGDDFEIGSKTITLNRDMTIPVGAEFIIPPDWTLDINGKKLSNNGTIVNLGTIEGANIEDIGGIKTAYLSFTSQPRDKTVAKGSTKEYLSAEVFVLSKSAVTLSYQWYRNTSTSAKGGTRIDDATSKDFAIPADSVGAFYYYVVVSAENAPMITSRAATIRVANSYSLTADPVSNNFGSQRFGYGAIVPQTFTVTNDGLEMIMDLNASFYWGAQSSFEISRHLSSGYPLPNETVTVDIRPKSGLAAGVYTDILTISGRALEGDNPSVSVPLSFTVVAVPTYIVTVGDGTGGGSFEAGAPVNIVANAAADGKVFDMWTSAVGVVFADASSIVTTFVMPEKAVTVTATYKDTPVPVYTATVQNGAGGGNYSAGTTVTIMANAALNGKVFDKWTSNDISFVNASSTATTFIMPAKAVIVTATYKDDVTDTGVFYPLEEDFGTFTGNGPLSAKIDADHTLFLRLLYGGTEVDPEHYTITQGSTIITLHEDYLRTFKSGTYWFTAEFANGRSEDIQLVSEVMDAQTPAGGAGTGTDTTGTGASTSPAKTADNAMPGLLWVIFLASAVSILCAIAVLKKRRRPHDEMDCW
jgi:hypothetical protein